MEEKIIKTIELKNGLSLELYDKSRRVAGNRWLVSFTARIEIPVNGFFPGEDDRLNVHFEEIRNALGEKILYEKKRERNFIAESEKDEVLNDLIDSFLSSSFSYLSHSRFPINFILKEFEKYKGREIWYKE